MSDRIEMPHPKAEVSAVLGVDEEKYGAELEQEITERLNEAFDSVEQVDVYTL
jgi:hypothetical protein